MRFSPVTTNPIIVSAGWDKLVKVPAPSLFTMPHEGFAASSGKQAVSAMPQSAEGRRALLCICFCCSRSLREALSVTCRLAARQVWNLTNCKLRADLRGHTGYINTVTVSPDGSLCASGGKVRTHNARRVMKIDLLTGIRTCLSFLYLWLLPWTTQIAAQAACSGIVRSYWPDPVPDWQGPLLDGRPVIHPDDVVRCGGLSSCNPEALKPSMQDGVAMLWDLGEGKRLYSLDAGDIIHALTFSPNRYWLCAATQVPASFRHRVAHTASAARLP